MALESVTNIADLVITNPTNLDPKSEGDDHIRNIKKALKTDLPNITGPITASQAELNVLDGITASTAELNLLDGVTATTAEINHIDGVTSPIQTQLDAKAPLASPALTGTPTAPTAAANTNTTQIATTAHVFAERTNTATLTNKTLTAPVINSPTGIVKGDVGLGNVDNTSDLNKPISTATQTALNNKQPLDADLTAIAAITSTGMLARTGSGTASVRTLTAGTGITITNGDGVSGNPTIAVDSGGLPASASSALISYLPAGTGAVSTTVQSKLREWVSVKDFGAVGDGVTDDTVAIQTAINVANGQRRVYFPYGIYKLTAKILANIAGTHLFGETNASTYGISPKSVIIKCDGFDVGDTRKVMIDTYANTTDYPTISNVPYVTMENIALDGNDIALVGFDGGFLTTHKNCSIVGCTPTGGVGYRIGRGQTSSHENCAYNGNYDGVSNAAGGTLYFDNCVMRQNTRYGWYGILSGCTFTNVIFESNASKGAYVTAASTSVFRSCYWEQNDAALGGAGANIQIDGAVTNRGLVFDNCVIGSTGTTLCAIINGGEVTFKDCSHVGTTTTNCLTISDSAYVTVDNSFETMLLPKTARVVPQIQVDQQSMMRVGTGQIVINSPSMIFGTGDFSINVVVAPNYSGVTIRDLIYGNAGAFRWVMSGSANGLTSLNFFKVGGAAFKDVSCVTPLGTPTMLTYVRASSVGYVYKNGQLLESFPDTNDYTVTQSLIGAGTLQSDLYEYAVWRTSALTSQQVFDLWKASGNAFRASLTPTLELDFTNRTPGRVINRTAAAGPRALTLSGNIFWVYPRLYDYWTNPTVGISGTLDMSAVTGDKYGITVSGNITAVTFPTGTYDGREFMLQMTQSGSFTIAGWPASVKLQGAAFTLTTGSGKIDTLRFVFRASDSLWIETARAQNC